MCLSNYLRSFGALAAACCEPLRSIHHCVYLAPELPAAPASKQSAAYFCLLLPPLRKKKELPVPTPHKRTTLMRQAREEGNQEPLCKTVLQRGGPLYTAGYEYVFLFFFHRCQTFLFGPVNSAVVLCGLWPDFLNRNHLSEAKWWLRDVIAAVRGWRRRRRKWWNGWKNSSRGCTYPYVRARWEGRDFVVPWNQ